MTNQEQLKVEKDYVRGRDNKQGEDVWPTLAALKELEEFRDRIAGNGYDRIWSESRRIYESAIHKSTFPDEIPKIWVDVKGEFSTSERFYEVKNNHT